MATFSINMFFGFKKHMIVFGNSLQLKKTKMVSLASQNIVNRSEVSIFFLRFMINLSIF